MKKNLIAAGFMFILTIFIFFLPSQPSALMVGLSTEALALGSETVILGEVEEVESQWSYDNRIIFTTAAILVDEVIRGICLKKRIEVEYRGGKVGDIGFGVSDSPKLMEGEGVLLFLKSGPSRKSRLRRSVYNIVGAAQGKYAIDEHEIARKGSFSILAKDKGKIDNNIDVQDLIEKIKSLKSGYRDEK